MLKLEWRENAEGRVVPVWESERADPGATWAAYVPSATYEVSASVEVAGPRIVHFQSVPRFGWGTAMASFIAH